MKTHIKYRFLSFIVTLSMGIFFSSQCSAQNKNIYACLEGDWKQSPKSYRITQNGNIIPCQPFIKGFTFLPNRKIIAYPSSFWRDTNDGMRWKYGFQYAVQDSVIYYRDETKNRNIHLKILRFTRDSLVIQRDSFIESYYKAIYNIDTVPKPDKIYYSTEWQTGLGGAPDYSMSIDKNGTVRVLGLSRNNFWNAMKEPRPTWNTVVNKDTIYFFIAAINNGFSNYITGAGVPEWIFDTLASCFRKANIRNLPLFYNMAGLELEDSYVTFMQNGKLINSFGSTLYPAELLWAYSTLGQLARTLKKELTRINPKYDIPIPAALKINNKTINLLPSEELLLYDLINKGTRTSINFEPEQAVYYGWYDGRITEDKVKQKMKHDTAVNARTSCLIELRPKDIRGRYKSMTYNGPYFKVVYENGDSLTIDIGVDIFRLLRKNIWNNAPTAVR